MKTMTSLLPESAATTPAENAVSAAPAEQIFKPSTPIGSAARATATPSKQILKAGKTADAGATGFGLFLIPPVAFDIEPFAESHFSKLIV